MLTEMFPLSGLCAHMCKALRIHGYPSIYYPSIDLSICNKTAVCSDQDSQYWELGFQKARDSDLSPQKGVSQHVNIPL